MLQRKPGMGIPERRTSSPVVDPGFNIGGTTMPRITTPTKPVMPSIGAPKAPPVGTSEYFIGPKGKSAPGVRTPPGKHLGWEKGVGNPHRMDSNKAKAQRQAKMVEKLKQTQGKLNSKGRSAIMQAARKRKGRKSFASGSIG